jgi:large subunit ribosomal protein L5
MDNMKQIKIEKITLNIGCGTKTNIEHAMKILESLSKRKAIITKTRKRTTFNVPKNKPIGCKVTIRQEVESFLKTLLEAKENKLSLRSFDSTGNFSFGIKEYIDVPGMEYEPKIGIMGLDVCVTLERPGYRVKRKRLGSKIGKNHLITKEDAIDFVREKFGVVVE